jgi:hypothetical protein
MSVRLVDSKEHMLSPNDIFIVAAHLEKRVQEMMAPAAKKAKVSPERMVYAMLVKQYSDKKLIRLREGNSLFTIAAMPQRIGFVRAYNGDTPNNFIANMVEFLDAARKMGFDFLVGQATSNEVVRMLKIAEKKTHRPGGKFVYNEKAKQFSIRTGEVRGEK